MPVSILKFAARTKPYSVKSLSDGSKNLNNFYVSQEEAALLKESANELNSWDLTQRQTCDLELILNGAFSPLVGFMDEKEYASVVSRQRLTTGALWPIPITLDVDQPFAEKLHTGEEIALRDPEGMLIAILAVSDVYTPDRSTELSVLFGDSGLNHSGVLFVREHVNEVYIGGSLRGIEAPLHHDFRKLRDDPAELRERFTKMGWKRIIGFQTRRPLHRREVNQTFRAARLAEANLLIHPAVGDLTTEEPYLYARVNCFEHVVKHYPVQTTDLTLTPLFPRNAGILDILLHAIVQKNSGCTHFMVNENYLNSELEEAVHDFDEVEQRIKGEYEALLGMELVHNEKMVYAEKRGGYVPVRELPHTEMPQIISDEDLRDRLNRGLEVPDWYSYPEVIKEVRKVVKSPVEQGLTVFFTGLSGSGKSSIANALLVKMMEIGGRSVTLLDGDIFRQNLSSELGFSRPHRDINIRRIGYVASEITKHGGVAICAPIAPYEATRAFVRDMVSKVGGFVEVHVATSLEECERRDRKGLYARARAGIIREFTGISDPYEVPENSELRIDTEGIQAEEAAQEIILKLERMGFISLQSSAYGWSL